MHIFLTDAPSSGSLGSRTAGGGGILEVLRVLTVSQVLIVHILQVLAVHSENGVDWEHLLCTVSITSFADSR